MTQPARPLAERMVDRLLELTRNRLHTQLSDQMYPRAARPAVSNSAERVTEGRRLLVEYVGALERWACGDTLGASDRLPAARAACERWLEGLDG